MGKHLLFWMFALAVLVFFSAGMLSAAKVSGLVQTDIHVAGTTVGKPAVATAISFANRWSAGMVNWIRANEAAPGAMVYAGHAYSRLAYNLVALAYLALFRLRLLIFWLLPALVIVAATGVDAGAARKVKLASYGYCSPVLYAASMHGLIAFVSVSVIYLFVPLPLWPLLPLVGLGVTALALHQAILNYQPIN